MKGNIQTAIAICCSFIIGLSVPYILLYNKTEIWPALLGFMVVMFLLFIFIKQQVSFSFLVLFSLLGIMNTSIKPFDLLFVFMFLVLLLYKKRKMILFLQFQQVHFSLFFFCVLSFLSITSSSNVEAGFIYFIHTVFVILIFYFIYLFAQEEIVFNSILRGYVFSAFFSGVLVFLEMTGIFTRFYTIFQGTRAKGLFLDPNDFAPFLVLSILLFLHHFTLSSLKSMKAYGYLFAAFFLTGILLSSLSRAAMLNLGISVVIYVFCFLLNRGSWKYIWVLLSFVSLSTIAVVFYMRTFIAEWLALRFNASTGGVMQSYDQDRFYFQLQGLKFGFTNLFGVGPGQFELLLNYATHNLFIRIIAENGFPAFIFFMIMILSLLVYCVKYQAERVWGIPIYLFLAGLTGLLVNSFFLDTLHWRYLWFYLGLCSVVLVNAKRNFTKNLMEVRLK